MADIQCVNNKINIYNMVLPKYSSFDSMRIDLDRLRELGINAVWLNPFFEISPRSDHGKTKRFAREILGQSQHEEKFWVQDSLYAATYEEYEKNGEWHYYLLNLQNPRENYSREDNEKVIQQVQNFTRIARECDITLMFDLVLNHVSMFSLLYREHKELFRKDQHFDDIAQFDYDECSDSEKNNKIFVTHWKKVIDFFIDTLGFRGVRVDCVSWTNPYIMDMAVRYITTRLPDPNTIIFGEFIGEEVHRNSARFQALARMQIPFTHIMTTMNELKPVSYCKRFAKLNISQLLATSALASKGLIGATGTHDRLPLRVKCEQEFTEKHPDFQGNIQEKEQEIIRLMKKKILMTIIGSNGGWYLMSGDEFGDTLVVQPPFLFKGADINVDSEKYNIFLVYRNSSPDFSNRKASKLPVLVKTPNGVYVYGKKFNGKCDYTKLDDIHAINDLPFPQEIDTSDVEVQSRSVPQKIYEEIAAKEGHLYTDYRYPMEYRYGRNHILSLAKFTRINLSKFIAQANEFAKMIQYHDIMPICLFNNQHNRFIAVGNFTYNGSNYIAFDLNEERLVPIGLDRKEIERYMSEYRVYQEKVVEPMRRLPTLGIELTWMFTEEAMPRQRIAVNLQQEIQGVYGEGHLDLGDLPEIGVDLGDVHKLVTDATNGAEKIKTYVY